MIGWFATRVVGGVIVEEEVFGEVGEWVAALVVGVVGVGGGVRVGVVVVMVFVGVGGGRVVGEIEFPQPVEPPPGLLVLSFDW